MLHQIEAARTCRFDSFRYVNYSQHMLDVLKSETFDQWLIGLKDRLARIRVLAHVDRLAAGNAGDAKPVGDGISELRIDQGPGYRVYFMRRGAHIVLLLCGGDKSTQTADIKAAKRIARDWQE